MRARAVEALVVLPDGFKHWKEVNAFLQRHWYTKERGHWYSTEKDRLWFQRRKKTAIAKQEFVEVNEAEFKDGFSDGLMTEDYTYKKNGDFGPGAYANEDRKQKIKEEAGADKRLAQKEGEGTVHCDRGMVFAARAALAAAT